MLCVFNEWLYGYSQYPLYARVPTLAPGVVYEICLIKFSIVEDYLKKPNKINTISHPESNKQTQHSNGSVLGFKKPAP